jgi:hypothetical protein
MPMILLALAATCTHSHSPFATNPQKVECHKGHYAENNEKKTGTSGLICRIDGV